MAKQYVPTVKTGFWIASILSVLILAIHVIASTQVTHYDTTDLGLLTKLPMTFWIGLSYLGVLLYVSRKSERRTIIVVMLISFYLFGIPVLTRENKAEWLPSSYYRSSQGVRLLSEDRLVLNNVYPLSSYNWPGFYYFAAFLVSSTGLPATVLSDYFPLLTIALLGIMTYSILRLQLNTIHSSFGALWFIGSFWVSQHYFGAQSFAYVIYFAIILLLAKLFFIKKQSITFPLSIIVLFTATVVSHLLTPLMIVWGVVAIYASFKISPLKVKKPPFYSIATCILLVSIFISYQLLVTSQNFSGIIETLNEQISQQGTHLSAISKSGRIIGSTSYLLDLVSSYGITIVNVVIAILAILITSLGLFFHKKDPKIDLFWIAWIIVAGVFGVSMNYGTYEAIERAFMFMLLPASYFSIKFLSKKPGILILVLMILIFIHIPADYSSEMYLMVPTSELKGTAFYEKYVPPNASYFYERFYGGLITYREKVARAHTQIVISPISPLFPLPSNELVKETTEKAEFIISSNLQKNFYLYFYGVDPLEHLGFDDQRNRIYDNEGFRIYARPF